MQDRPFQSFEVDLPDGWWIVDPSPLGVTIQAQELDPDGFGSSVVADFFFRDAPDGDLDWLREFHHGQLMDMSRTMTDALVVDDAAIETAGRPGWGTTVAFRQGWWTVTAFIRTVEAPGGVVLLAFLCDADRLETEYEVFAGMVESVQFEAVSDV